MVHDPAGTAAGRREASIARLLTASGPMARLAVCGKSPSMDVFHLKPFGFRGSRAPGTSSMRCRRRLVHSLLVRRLSLTMMLAVLMAAGGCQSHLNQQLLERELRLQEDQIYRLQDVLDEKISRLEHIVQENASLRKQLGYGDRETTRGVTSRGGGSQPPSGSARSGGGGAALVPPTIDLSVPGAAPAPRTLPPPSAPPMLEGVPPLPAAPPATGTPSTRDSDAPPASAAIPEVTLPGPEAFPDGGIEPANPDDGPSFAPVFGAPQAAAPRVLDDAARQATALLPPDQPDAPGGAARGRDTIEQLSFTQPAHLAAAGGAPERIVINRELTGPFDADGDGVAEALAVVFEPRDAAERLVEAVGDVSIAISEAAVTGAPATLATWTVPADEATATFRRTSRSRGVRLLLPWPGQPPRGLAGTVHVRLVTAYGPSLDADAPISFGVGPRP